MIVACFWGKAVLNVNCNKPHIFAGCGRIQFFDDMAGGSEIPAIVNFQDHRREVKRNLWPLRSVIADVLIDARKADDVAKIESLTALPAPASSRASSSDDNFSDSARLRPMYYPYTVSLAFDAKGMLCFAGAIYSTVPTGRKMISYALRTQR